MRILSIVFLVCLLLTSCQSKRDDNKKGTETSPALQLPKKPNILWLVTEDMGAYIPPFGDLTAETPNLNRLASEGVIYPNLYSDCSVFL